MLNGVLVVDLTSGPGGRDPESGLRLLDAQEQILPLADLAVLIAADPQSMQPEVYPLDHAAAAKKPVYSNCAIPGSGNSPFAEPQAAVAADCQGKNSG